MLIAGADMALARDVSRPALPAAETPPEPLRERRPLRDNPRLILLGIVAAHRGARRDDVSRRPVRARSTPTSSPRSLLYALSAADLTMLIALVFVLARNIVKLVVERRRGLPFSRFRAKLVLAMLGLTIVPSVLVLLVGGELIRQTTARWFADADRGSAAVGDRRLRSTTTPSTRRSSLGHAEQIARRLSAAGAAVGRRRIDPARRSRETSARGASGSSRSIACSGDGPPRPVVAVESPALPERARAGLGGPARGAHRLRQRRQHHPRSARRAVANWFAPASSFADPSSGAPHRRRHRERPPGGLARAALAPDHATPTRATAAARPASPALEGVYLSVFLMMTLMILVSATWMGLYLAKRITRPVQLLAAGAREIGAGRLDHRIEPETRDEFGSLVEAFNTMAGELAASQQKLERSRLDLEQKNVEVEERRRYIETILERIATGVVSIDRGPADRDGERRGGAAARVERRRDRTAGRRGVRSRRSAAAAADHPAGAGRRRGAGGRRRSRSRARAARSISPRRRPSSRPTAASPAASCWCSMM